jgi:outer membrane protein assembly factor BamD (BamD/ComL family)
MLYRSLCACALASLMIPALSETAAAQQDPKTSAQPDKVLYDHGLADVQKKRFESARLLLQTLIYTYGSSEYVPKAHLALAESWFKEGGARGLDRAREQCSLLTQQFPDSPEAKQALDMLREIEDLKNPPSAK